ncbi:peptidoglycan biosynthesis protein MviN/MurJ (putative lipid II flippase) [Paraburkholderia unamae]|uniref:Peptidoglycan biosynthesis protein MviN/MurJ (Putative lipid II flippase) n=2 Tax=Paraburkholderia unamae TaxID=219649 RepID=A0ABX5KGN8_9BURK|nr:peptidoglycan biosynthesis protein MviN/MurJ (putative lipid II flippase) [Paraburkholderia unamae]RAR58893.1 peptidoglycan biosynthesis protein MviN/MurJ (putative lipid II flippase) [Paraburkholderia unamae]
MARLRARHSFRFQDSHAMHRRIIQGAAWVSFFVFIGKFAGAFKEMAIAYRYGVSSIVDAYQLTLTLVTWIPGTLVTILSTVLIPTLVRLRHAPPPERREFIAELQGCGLMVSSVITLLLFVFWQPALSIVSGKLSTQTQDIVKELARGIMPIGILTVLISIQSARLQARERHINTLLECVPALTLLATILLTPPSQAIHALMLGTTIGYALQLTWLTVLSGKADQTMVLPKFTLCSREWPKLCMSVGIFSAGQLLMSCVTPVDQYFVAHLGDGAIGSLGYANRLLALVMGMGALAISRAVLPVFSELQRAGDGPRAGRIAWRWTVVTFIGAICVALFASLFSKLAVAMLYQRGAFTSTDTAVVANLLRWGLVQIPFYFPVLVMVQLFASQGRFKAMTIIASINFFVKVIADLCLINWLGLAGIQLATAMMHASSLACYLLFEHVSKGKSKNGGVP